MTRDAAIEMAKNKWPAQKALLCPGGRVAVGEGWAEEGNGIYAVGVRWITETPRTKFGDSPWKESFDALGRGNSYEAAFADATRRGTGYKDETATETGREG